MLINGRHLRLLDRVKLSNGLIGEVTQTTSLPDGESAVELRLLPPFGHPGTPGTAVTRVMVTAKHIQSRLEGKA